LGQLRSWQDLAGSGRDISETIDFLEFYGREMLRPWQTAKTDAMRGERNYLVYSAGRGRDYPPWEFPCAIMAGLVVASFGQGNTVVLKARRGLAGRCRAIRGHFV